jgi:putative peptide zinc metalloprotease protein
MLPLTKIALESGVPVGLRARADLRVVQQRSGGVTRWAVKDPVSLRYFHLGEAEMFLLRLLQRPRTCQELKERFEGEFPPARISREQILEFCARLHAHQLLIADGPGQAAVLRQRLASRRRDSIINALFGVLAIRLPGVRAEPLLAWLAWPGRCLFSRSCALAALVVFFVAALLLLGRADELVRELPTWHELAQPAVFACLVLAMIVVKVGHELGHGLACRRFGGECHEMGVMLLAFAPCLYCDVSDSWMFATRWQRIVVTLAGIYVELLLAALAAMLWYFSEPGAVHTMSICLVITCTVSTILINGNPLLRYDGYYVLSDLLSVPNLDEQSRRALWEPILRWITRRGEQPEALDGSRWWLASYAAAASAYRLFVLGIILWFIHHLLTRNHLRPLADVLVVVVFCGILVQMSRTVFRSVRRVPAWRLGGVALRAGVLAGLAAAALWLVLNFQFEQRTEVAFQLEAAGAVSVFSPLGGQLVEGVGYGQPVREGQLLARLRDQHLELQLESLAGRVQEIRTRLATMTIRAQQYPALFAELATTRTVDADLRRQQATLREEQQRLAVRAPADGIVLRPLAGYAGPRSDSLELPAWGGAPLDGPNRGCYLKDSDLICLVGHPRRLQAIAHVDARDIGLIAVGDQVRLRLDEHPGESIRGRVMEIGLSDLRALERESVGGHRPDRRNELFSDGFAAAQYHVRMGLDQQPAVVRHGSGGIARIVTGRETIAQMIQRFVHRIFRFHF